MGDAATPTLPNFTTQTAAVYKTNIDAGFAVADRLSWAFAPHEQAAPDMTVRVDAGAIFDGATLSEVAAQSTGTITAPTTDPRIDRVVIDQATGTVSVITGAEAPSPTPPAITAGKVPVARVSLVVSQTSIVNADLTDERDLGLLGLGSLAIDDINGLTEDADPATAADFVATFDASAGGLKKVKLENLGITDDVARDNIMLNAFRIAINGGLSVLNMQDGIVDEFEDETGVDNAASTNEVYDAAGDFYTNTSEAAVAQGAGTAIGDLSSGEGAGLAAAFDGTTSQTAVNSARTGNAVTGWIGKNWGGGTTRVITKVVWYGPSDGGIHETDTTIRLRVQESATGAWSGEETTIGDTGTFDGSVSSLVKTITCSGASAKQYHRVLGTEGASNEKWACAELEFSETGAPANMTLIANAFTAEATPTDARIVLFEEDVDAVTVNTNLKAYASRDGGTTYTQITLADEGDFETDKRILAGSVDISGQPSGTSMKYKIETLNAKELKLHGVALQWS